MSQSPISPPTPPSPPVLPPPVDPPPVTPPPETPPVTPPPEPPPVTPPPVTPPVPPPPVPPPETPPSTPPPETPPPATPPETPPPNSPPPPRPPIAPPTPETPPVTPTPPTPDTPPVSPTPPTPDTPPGTPTPPSPPVTPTPPSPNGGPPPTAPPPRQLLSPPPPPPPINSTSAQSSSAPLSTPAIAGIAAAGVIGLIFVAILLFFLSKKRNRRDSSSDYPGDTYELQPPAQHVMKIPPSNPQSSSVITGSSMNSPGPDDPLLTPLAGLSIGKSKITFTYEELSAATDGFSDANLLGQGGFGYVHLGTLPNGKQVAVKQLKVGSVQGEREFQAEVEIISRVHHKHLVSLVGYCIHGGKRLLVYEYVPNNTLEFQLHGKGRPVLDWPTRLKIALGAARGLAYLHEDCQPKIIHRDIKASNILLDYKFEAKLADFGLAKSASEANTHVSTRVMGTFGYLAPEYAASGKLTDKSDVFSFGVMLLELITGRRPVNAHNDTFMEDSLVDWARPKLAQVREDGKLEPIVDPRLQGNYNPDEMLRLIACAATCVRHSARRRPRISQIVRVLEGDISLEDLNEGLTPGQSLMYGLSTDYGKGQYSEDMRRFRKLALDSQDYLSSEYSESSSQFGVNQSISSSEDFTSREMENIRKYREDIKRHRKPPLGSHDYTSSEYSAATSEYGLNQTTSSTEEYATRESQIPKSKRTNIKGFSGGMK